MYEKLISDLRDTAEYIGPNNYELPIMLYDNLLKAADAIEELSRENESLAKSVNEASEILRKRWIPVTERLPNQYDGLLYICLIVGGEYDQLSWYELCDFAEGRFWTMESESECHVTHWMPLPQPPKEG